MSLVVDKVLFSEWLMHELNARGWSQADLARKAGVNRQVISTYINGLRSKPDEDILQSIADAFGIPPETVFRAAGLLPNIPNQRQAAEEILGFKINELSDEEIDDLLVYIEFIQAKRGRGKSKNREGVTPPDLIKK